MRLGWIAVVVWVLGWSNLCMAQSSYYVALAAGDASVDVEIESHHTIPSGYLRVGGGANFYDHKDKEYDLFYGVLGVGADSFTQGLQTNLGFKALGGQVDKGNTDGNVGALGFNVDVAYRLEHEVLPLPTQVFWNLTWAPGVLCFSELDKYYDIGTGVGVEMLPNAFVQLSYHYRQFDMEDQWSVDTSVVSLGLAISF